MPILMPPHTDTGRWGDGKWRNDASDLWNYGWTYPEGQAIVKIGGEWQLAPVIDLDVVEEYYGGGRTHIISIAKATELTLAGFGEYIFDDGGDGGLDLGFGEGEFGDGGFGL